MTAIRNSDKIVGVEFNYEERTIKVSIYRIQKETSAYSRKTYNLKEGVPSDGRLALS